MGQAVTLDRVWLPSPNWSSRGGTAIRLLVLHTAQGAANFYELGAFFASPAAEASSHVGIDDTPGAVGEYLHPADKAWTQAQANPYSLSAELCAWAEWGQAEWDRHPAMLANAAAWLAEESAAHGIPLTRLSSAQAQGGAAGVCQHVDLGAAGGGHWDCGSNFPLDRVLAMARGDTATTLTGGPEMALTDPSTGGVWVTDDSGAVFAYDGAPYLGGTNNASYNAAGWPCVGICAFSGPGGDGYCLVLDTLVDSPGVDRYRRYRFPRDGSARR